MILHLNNKVLKNINFIVSEDNSGLLKFKINQSLKPSEKAWLQNNKEEAQHELYLHYLQNYIVEHELNKPWTVSHEDIEKYFIGVN